jgi:hypothetical protein
MTDLHVGDQVRTGIIAMEQYYKAVRPDGTSFYDERTQWELGRITRHPSADLEQHGGSPARYLSVSVSPTDCTGFRWPARLFRVVPVCGHKVIAPDRPDLPNKRASDAWKPVEELPAHQLFGPQGVQVAALIDRSRNLTASEIDALVAAWDAARIVTGPAAWDAARDAARAAARDAARAAARAAARVAAWDAARAAAWDAARAAARVAARDAARDAARAAAWDAARAAAWDAARAAAWDAARVAAWDAGDAARALVVRDLITTDEYDRLTRPWRQAIGRIHPDDAEVAA